MQSQFDSARRRLIELIIIDQRLFRLSSILFSRIEPAADFQNFTKLKRKTNEKFNEFHR